MKAKKKKTKKRLLRRKAPKTKKIVVELPLKLEPEDALFIAYYYICEMRGSYPFLSMVDGRLSEFPGELFKHFIRNMLGMKNYRMETQIINCLRTFTKSQIIKKTYTNFQVLKRRKNVEERILFVYNKLASIKSGWNKPETEIVEVIMDIDETKNDVENVVENNVESSAAEKPVYKSIEEYTAKTGKRFRLLKTDKEAGLSREDAFKKRFGLNG